MSLDLPFKLPQDVLPFHYDVQIAPHMENSTSEFTGSVKIHFLIKNPMNSIILNSTDLIFTKVALNILKTNETWTLEPSKVVYNTEIDTATLHFPQLSSCTENERITLSIDFSSEFSRDLMGFYKSSYKSADGMKRTVLCTQFAPVYCRKAIPCLDEPALKATFSLTLIVDESTNSFESKRRAVSNMPILREFVENGKKTIIFEKTPLMSTYLLCFVVGEFDFIEHKTENDVLVRVYTPVGHPEQGKFALNIACKSLDFYTKYFEIEYPLPKIDLLAIPDFSFGATENWGCITYRTTALLVDENNSSAISKQRVALIVAHEIAHQWFGNLVTMEWWTHLWLNEGFASWVEYLAVDHIFPDWNIWNQFVASDMRMAMELDSLQSSHAVEVEVTHAKYVNEIFDAISYSKGATVIRMLVAYLGVEPFRKGIISYLNRYAYNNASTQELWAVLGESSGRDVGKFMSVWTGEIGFPLVIVDSVRNLKISLSQKRFLSNGCDVKDSTEWSIPIDFIMKTANNSEGTEVLETKTASFDFPMNNASEWFKLNSGQQGMYRVLYEHKAFLALITAIKKGQIASPLDRLGIQNDAFALNKAGYLKIADLLLLISAYGKETDYTVWTDLVLNIKSLARIMRKTKVYNEFCSFLRRIFGRMIDSLGWEEIGDKDHTTTMLRSLILECSVLYGFDDVIKEACRRFSRFLSGEELSADLRLAVYMAAVMNGDRLGFESVRRLYEVSDLQEEKVRCLVALASSRSAECARELLDMSLTDSVRSQDVIHIYRSIVQNPVALEVYWEFVQEKWALLVERYRNTSLLGGFVKGLGLFCEEEKVKEISSFFDQTDVTGGSRALRQAVEMIETNVLWLERDTEAAETWLSKTEG